MNKLYILLAPIIFDAKFAGITILISNSVFLNSYVTFFIIFYIASYTFIKLPTIYNIPSSFFNLFYFLFNYLYFQLYFITTFNFIFNL